jgi:glyoxylase-like metal-dependent hydrolase (beta-lactamase superfamily II)
MASEIVVDYLLGETIPAPGAAIEVAPGVHWIRMPLPFALDHINLWLLEDGDGWVIVDCGYGAEATWKLWEDVFAGPMGGRKVNRLVVTHYHPDHVGSAGWLTERLGVEMWMTAAEYLSAHAAVHDTSGFDRENSIALLKSHGLDDAGIPERMRKGNGYASAVTPLPKRYRRMMHGDKLAIGGHDWEVITVFGHAPEHAALWCASKNVLISGDQLLPRITTNVSVWGSQPESDPVKLFLDSMESFSHLPADTLVLPSHDRVFRNMHERIRQLREHHAERLDWLYEACETPKTATEVLPVLFKRKLDGHQMMFAMGEAVAHLNRLMYAGRLKRTLGPDGVLRFQRT